jgi:hypothetical protein
MKVFDYTCPNGHTHERFTREGANEVTCESCGLVATKVIGTPAIKLEGWSGSFPGAAMKWERDHERRGKTKPLD